jgi:hypothetical protein
MANPTSNYGFVLPTSSDLVTDLPADFDVALQGVDTRLKALQPGTTLGDLAYSSATANTNTRLAIGTSNQVLTVSGGVPAWVTPAGGGGKILQVVQGTTTTETTIASTTMTDSSITATITPTLSTSKVLILISYAVGMYNGSESSRSYGGRIMRGATEIFDRQTPGIGYVDDVLASGSHSGHGVGISGAMVYLDSPATTSATTYKLQGKCSALGSGGVGLTFQGNGAVGSIVLMEVGA